MAVTAFAADNRSSTTRAFVMPMNGLRDLSVRGGRLRGITVALAADERRQEKKIIAEIKEVNDFCFQICL